MSQSTGQQDIVRLPEMTPAEMEKLLASQKICRMALNDEPWPYIIALDDVYADGEMDFHFADYGRKMGLIEKDANVSVEVDNFCSGTASFCTITLMGRLARVTDRAEKEMAAKALRDSAGERGGLKNVAARHGSHDLDMATLTSGKSALYKLVADEFVALKSP
jgi:uncharacterized protein